MLLTGATSAQASTFNFSWAAGWDVDAVAPAVSNEVCSVAANCKLAAPGSLGGQISGSGGIGDLAVDPVSGAIYVTDPQNRRIEKFDAAGNFVAVWGKDVIAGGGTGYEICTVAADCKQGEFGGLGGEFISPQGIAVDGTGFVYVTDSTRVQKFTSAGSFARMWGKDVDSAAGTGPEVCTVAANCQLGNSAAQKGGEFNQAAGIDVTQGGAVYVGEGAGHRIQKFTSLGAFQLAWGKDVQVGGSTGFEICSVSANCKAGVSGALGGEMGNPASVAADFAGSVYVGDYVDKRIQKFDSSGNFERAWGKDVDSAAGTGAEICTVAANCQAGSYGGLAGELGSFDVVAESPGDVFVGDSYRVQEFDPDGHFIRTFGKNVAAGGGTGFEICASAPRCLGGQSAPVGGAFNRTIGISLDAAGNLYVGDYDGRRFQKFSLGPDLPPPETTIVSGPSGVITDDTPTFTFSSSKPDSSFECSVDGGAFGLCSGPGATTHTTSPLADGAHTFAVRATDSSANTDPTPASRSFTVDTTAPATSITDKPARKLKTKKKKVKVEVAFSGEAGSSFECRLDNAPFKPCASPFSTKVKAKGGKGKKHTISIRATDAAGNVEAAPATVRFRAVRKR